MNSAVLSSQQTITSSKFNFLEFMVNTLDRSMSTLHVYEPTIFNRDFLYYGCFHCLFAPASLPWDAFK